MSEAPAHNLAAEEAVLGAMLVNEGALRAVLGVSGLRPEHFYRERHRLIFRAAARLAALNEAVDALTVAGELERQGKLADAGGREAVAHLGSNALAPGNAPHHAALVIEAAQLRAYATGAQRILEGVAARDRELIQRGIEEASVDLEHEAEPVEPIELADYFADWLFEKEPARVFKTGFTRLDNLAGGGLYPGQMTAVIGWPSDGKSTLIDQLIATNHEAGVRTLVLATEMPARDRVARFVASKTGLPWAKLMLRDLTDEAKQKTLGVLDAIPFAYRRVKGWSVEHICTEMAMRRADLVVLDSLHGLEYRDAGELRAISGRLQSTAARLGCHLLLVCQLNMARATATEYPEPVERDIRDSGAIAYDVDNILSVYRDRRKDGTREETGILRWRKARNGIPGIKVGVRLIPGGYGFEPLIPPKKAKEEPAMQSEPDQGALVAPFDN